MPVAKRAWDAQAPKDQAVLVWQLPVPELIPRLATKGLGQVPGGRVQGPATARETLLVDVTV
jgi:hypothetical protein